MPLSIITGQEGGRRKRRTPTQRKAKERRKGRATGKQGFGASSTFSLQDYSSFLCGPMRRYISNIPLAYLYLACLSLQLSTNALAEKGEGGGLTRRGGDVGSLGRMMQLSQEIDFIRRRYDEARMLLVLTTDEREGRSTAGLELDTETGGHGPWKEKLCLLTHDDD